MRIIFFIILSIIKCDSFGQQYPLKELQRMILDKPLFEQMMTKVGNYPISVYKNVLYYYRTKSGGMNTIFPVLEEYFTANENMTHITKSTTLQSSFAENYNTSDEMASTFYFLSIDIRKSLRGELIKDRYQPSAILRIQYARKSDYLKITNEISKTGRFVELRKDFEIISNEEYSSVYQIGKIEYELKKSNDRDSGGSLTMILKN